MTRPYGPAFSVKGKTQNQKSEQKSTDRILKFNIAKMNPSDPSPKPSRTPRTSSSNIHRSISISYLKSSKSTFKFGFSFRVNPYTLCETQLKRTPTASIRHVSIGLCPDVGGTQHVALSISKAVIFLLVFAAMVNFQPWKVQL